MWTCLMTWPKAPHVNLFIDSDAVNMRAGFSEEKPARLCFCITAEYPCFDTCIYTGAPVFCEAFSYEVMEQDLASGETVRLTLPETSSLPDDK